MTQSDEDILQQAGWAVECYSPLELRHEPTDSFATGLAAKLVLQAVRDEQTEPPDTARVSGWVSQFDSMVQALAEVVETARKTDDEQTWKLAFDLVFSDNGAGRVRRILEALGLELTYHDPDTSYEEDAVAFVGALQDLHRQVKPLLEAMKKAD